MRPSKNLYLSSVLGIFTKKIILAVSVCLIFMLVSFLVYDRQITAEADTEKKQIENKYAERKNSLNQNLQSINSDLASIKNIIGETVSQKNTYLEQKKQVENDIVKGESLLTNIKLVIAQLDEELIQKDKDITERKLKVKSTLKQLQSEGGSSTFEVIFSGEDFGSIITQLSNVNSLQDKLVESTQSLNQAKKEQEDLKNKALETKKDEEDALKLLEIKKLSLEELVATYAQDEARYQQDLLERQQAVARAQAELNKVDADRASELDALRKKREAELAAAQPVVSKPPSGGGNNSKPVGNGNYGTCSNRTISQRLPLAFGVWGSPADGVVTQRYGTTTIPGNSLYSCHNGVDVAAPTGTPLFAVTDGVVAWEGFAAGGYGNFVVIQHTVPGAGSVYALYAHMQFRTPLKIGNRVSRGNVVGRMGSTGFSTGPHLHFTLIDGESYTQGSYGAQGLYYNPQDYIAF
jgi:murein DD-endopeptidase MepM/ murein hydrolase activator NlpD